MLTNYQVDESIPLPARNLGNIVQTALKVQRKIAADLIHDGYVSVNGRIRNQTHFVLDPGDSVAIEYLPQPVPARSSPKPKDGRIEIVHEDAFVLVVLKPPNLLTVPTPHRESNTLISQLTKYLAREKASNEAFCVHRLDRGVSGLLVFAKSLEIAHTLRNQFAERKPARQYAAIVSGNIKQEKGTFRSFLATDSDLNRYSTHNEELGELAITHYQVREFWGTTTYVEVWLETGRRNQIRVHFAEADHPIIGDPRYQRTRAIHPAWPYNRLALHAESLGFSHPVTGEPLQFRSPWPEEFRMFKRQVEKTK